jgi:Icc-related predicted phosphoesterase
LSRRTTRILFATDVHGSERTFRKFLNASKIYDAQIAILGGDLTGKSVVPIVTESDGSLSCNFLGSKIQLKEGREEMSLSGKIADIGYYPYRINAKELEDLKGNSQRTDEILVELMTERLQRWLQLAEDVLSSTSVKCFITGGNDDPFIIESILDKSQFVTNPENKVLWLDDCHEMISCAYSNHTPWNTPRELSEDQLAVKIGDLCANVQHMKRAVFNLHVPPLDSGLDTCPKLDTSTDPPRPIVKGGRQVMAGAGSSAVRRAIEKYKPLLGLHGHIHESRAIARLNGTLCINPGSEYGEGILRAALINLREDTVSSYQFISG